MIKKESFQKAQMNQLDDTIELYNSCKSDLLNRNIYQWGKWNDDYPSQNHIHKAISKGQLYHLIIEDELVGAVILNENQSNEWKQVKWTVINGSVLVIHAMVINPKHQNKGFGKRLLVYCEEYAKENRYACLRLDSFTKNPISNKLYQKFGYNKVGVVEFNIKPEGNMEYYCFEKIL